MKIELKKLGCKVKLENLNEKIDEVNNLPPSSSLSSSSSSISSPISSSNSQTENTLKIDTSDKINNKRKSTLRKLSKINYTTC